MKNQHPSKDTQKKHCVLGEKEKGGRKNANQSSL